MTQSVEGVHHQVRKDVLGLLGLGAAVLLLGLGLAWALAGSLSRPLQNLAKAARRVAGGDMQARATPAGSSEQVEVANAFNDMTERLGADAGCAARLRRQRLTPAAHAADGPAPPPGVSEPEGLGSRPPARPCRGRAGDRAPRQAARQPLEARSGRAEARGRARRPRRRRRPGRRALARAGRTRRARDRPRRRRDEVEIAATNGDLDTILDNLLENAFNYTPAGEPITVHGDAITTRRSSRCSTAGRVSAEDEGDHVFDRFYRGRSSQGGGVPGTGLGLAIVETLARRWGGSATLVNRPDGGARARGAVPDRQGPLPGAANGDSAPRRSAGDDMRKSCCWVLRAWLWRSASGSPPTRSRATRSGWRLRRPGRGSSCRRRRRTGRGLRRRPRGAAARRRPGSRRLPRVRGQRRGRRLPRTGTTSCATGSLRRPTTTEVEAGAAAAAARAAPRAGVAAARAAAARAGAAARARAAVAPVGATAAMTSGKFVPTGGRADRRDRTCSRPAGRSFRAAAR